MVQCSEAVPGEGSAKTQDAADRPRVRKITAARSSADPWARNQASFNQPVKGPLRVACGRCVRRGDCGLTPAGGAPVERG